jgi:hypothetical protein
VTVRWGIAAYGIAVVAVAAAWLGRWVLDPWLGDELSFSTFYLALIFSAWRSGLGPGLLSLALGAVLGDYFLAEPRHALGAATLADRLDLLRFVVVGSCVSAIGEMLHGRRRVADDRGELLRVVLASIGGRVVPAGGDGRIAARKLVGWKQVEAAGRPIEAVFRLVGEDRRLAVEDPAAIALREGLLDPVGTADALASRGAAQ